MSLLSNKINYLEYGATTFSGYSKYLSNHVLKHHLLKDKDYALFVNQFRIHSDTDHGWRGEFWGKFVRGAVLNYRANKDERLYQIITNSVEDLLSTQDKLGRITTYPVNLEFTDWDLWTRKYVMLALIYYYDICRSERLKKRIINALKKHADYILRFIGDKKGQTPIQETFHYDPVASLNSSSILEPIMRLYDLTHEARYLKFAKHIVDSGMSYQTNVVAEAIKNKLYPYQFKVRKAYEMMSCFEGLLEYYRVTHENKYLKAVINFVDKILASDFTIIGSSGVDTEFFNHSSITQTDATKEVGQETCVTVTLMKLLKKVYLFTGDVKYLAPIERAIYNALYGAINDTNQTMKLAHATVWYDDGSFKYVPHESFEFDSYSPLYMNRRGTGVGGFRTLQNKRSYGCCACNGSNGVALPSLLAVTKDDKHLMINLFDTYETKTKFNDDSLTIKVTSNPYSSSKTLITIKGNKKPLKLKIRIPDWMENVSLRYANKTYTNLTKDSYFTLLFKENDPITITYEIPIKIHCLNHKVAFTRGPITLARDHRLDNIRIPLKKNELKFITVATNFKNNKFKSNIALSYKNIHLVDYASAGKDYDNPSSLITVWQDVK